MPLKLYNTLTKKKEDFIPLNKDKITLYACGPTVYHYAHIGNLRTYIFNDILRRTLKFLNYKLTHVMNITDVGHLTSDQDVGEDKMEKGAKREKKTVWNVAKFYTDAFMQDLKNLNIQTPDIIPKATDYIDEMIDIIKILEKKGYTYKTHDGIYFNTCKFKRYCDFANLNAECLEEGKRIDMKEKLNKTDFALWKFSPKNKKRAMEWDSPFGKGFPGWHIECSAMSSKLLGKQIDIHTGGIDHIPIHHTNEIAQSECAFEITPWVRYWLHGEFLVIDKGKMSKSKDNFLTLKKISEKYDPIIYRYFCLTANYRQQLHFSFKALDSANNSYNNLKNKILELKRSKDDKKTDIEIKTRYETDFIDIISDDLNMPKALALLNKLLKEKYLSNKDKLSLIYDFDKVLGLRLKDIKKEKIEIPKKIQDLIEKRNKARKDKDYKLADKLRDNIKDLGYDIEDKDKKTEIKKI